MKPAVKCDPCAEGDALQHSHGCKDPEGVPRPFLEYQGHDVPVRSKPRAGNILTLLGDFAFFDDIDIDTFGSVRSRRLRRSCPPGIGRRRCRRPASPQLPSETTLI